MIERDIKVDGDGDGVGDGDGEGDGDDDDSQEFHTWPFSLQLFSEFSDVPHKKQIFEFVLGRILRTRLHPTLPTLCRWRRRRRRRRLSRISHLTIFPTTVQ